MSTEVFCVTPLPKLLYNTSPRVNGHSLRRGWRCDLTSLRDRLAVVFFISISLRRTGTTTPGLTCGRWRITSTTMTSEESSSWIYSGAAASRFMFLPRFLEWERELLIGARNWFGPAVHFILVSWDRSTIPSPLNLRSNLNPRYILFFLEITHWGWQITYQRWMLAILLDEKNRKSKIIHDFVSTERWSKFAFAWELTCLCVWIKTGEASIHREKHCPKKTLSNFPKQSFNVKRTVVNTKYEENRCLWKKGLFWPPS